MVKPVSVALGLLIVALGYSVYMNIEKSEEIMQLKSSISIEQKK